MRFVALAIFMMLGSCGGEETPPSLEEKEPVPSLGAVDHLVRASLALRGVRPSIDELEAVHADSNALSGIVDTYLGSDEFLLTMADMHGEHLQVRTEALRLPAIGTLEGVDGGLLFEALAESSLELVKHIVANDLPYTELVTADYSMGSALSSRMLAFMEGYDTSKAEDWQPVTWADGRPMAGVLTDPGLWIRHVSNGNNYHRARSDFIADTFLCSSFLTRDIPIGGGIDLADDDAVAHAVSTQTECVGCHQALDPLAATLWGTRESISIARVNRAYENDCEGKDAYYCYPIPTFSPDSVGRWEEKGLRPPGYYGLPAEDLEEVGEAIAEDPRFSQCTVRRFYSYLAQMDRDILPLDVVVDYAEAFESSGFDAKALAKSIVLSESFAADHAAVVDADPHVAAMQVLRPRQLGRSVAALTGFEWQARVDESDCQQENRCWGDVDLLLSDGFGFRTMMGGADGYVVSTPTHTSTPVRALVLEAFAAEASSFAVDSALATGQSKLLTLVGPDTRDEATIRLQLVALHKLLWGEFVASDSTEVDETYELFSDVLKVSDDLPFTWKMVLSAFFQDTRFTHY